MKRTGREKLVGSGGIHKKRKILIAIFVITLAVALVVLIQNKNTLYGRAVTTVLPVTACGVLNVEGGMYELQNDIVNTVSGSDCIKISAKNIQLDGKGYKINSATESYGLSGIRINSSGEGANVQNVVMENNHIGIILGDTKKITISNVKLKTPSSGEALSIIRTNDTTISNSDLSAPFYYAVKILDAKNISAKNNTFYGDSVGIYGGVFGNGVYDSSFYQNNISSMNRTLYFSNLKNSIFARNNVTTLKPDQNSITLEFISINNSFAENIINTFGTGKPFDISSSPNINKNTFYANTFYQNGVLSPDIILTETGTQYSDPPRTEELTVLTAEIANPILPGSVTATGYVNGLPFEMSTSDNTKYQLANRFPEGQYNWYAAINDSRGNVVRTPTKNFGVTTVTTCGNLYGNITLRNNVQATGNCFVISANNVTIDGNGYSIIGDGSGSMISNYVYGNNAVIKNFNGCSRGTECSGIFKFAKGISMVNVNNTQIYNNTISPAMGSITNFDAIGIDISESSNTNISNNNMSSSTKAGIKLSQIKPSANTIQQNNIFMDGVGGDSGGIIIEQSIIEVYKIGGVSQLSTVNIFNNSVSTASTNSPAIIFNGTPMIVMKGNILTTAGQNSPGILLSSLQRWDSGSGSITSVNDTIQTSNYFSSAMELSDAINAVYLFNDSLYSQLSPNINTNSGSVYLYNTAFDKNNVWSVTGSGFVHVYWLAKARVLNGSEPVQNAYVYAYDVNKNSWGGRATDKTGHTEAILLREFTQDSTGKTYYSPYTFNATKQYKFFDNITKINIDNPNMVVNISLIPDKPGTITLNKPDADAIVGRIIYFNYSINDDSPLHELNTRTNLIIDGITKYTLTNTPNGTIYFPYAMAGIPDGLHNWYVEHRDAAENVVTSEIRMFTLDAKSPDVIIQSPISEKYYSRVIPISAIITDASGVSKAWVNISVPNSNEVLKQIILKKSGDVWTETFDSTTIQDGQYTLSFIANDTLNNAGDYYSARTNVNVDNTIPAINSFNAPANNAVTNEKILYTSLLIKELNPWNCAFMINGQIINTKDLSQVFVDSTNPLSQCLFSVNMGDGTHYYNITITDKAGNSATSETRKITIDTSAPVISLGLAGNTKPVRNNKIIRFSATVTDQNIDTVLIGKDTILALAKKMTSASGGTYTLESTLYELGCTNQGNCNIVIKANDTVGNTVTSNPITFTIDNTAPIIFPSSPKANSWYNSAFQIKTDIEDQYSAILASNYVIRDVSPPNAIIRNVSLSKDASGYWTANLQSLPPDGSYSHYITAIDEAENIGKKDLGYLHVDATLPNIKINSPTKGYYKSIIINATITEANIAEANYSYTLNGVETVGIPLQRNNDQWTSDPSIIFGDGNYTFTIIARDYANNIQRSTVGDVIIDKTNPSSINFAAQTPKNNSVIPQGTFTANVSFVEANPDNCVLTIKNSAGSETNYPMAVKGNNCNATITGIADGNHSYFVTLTDKVGFTGVSGQRFVTIDTTAPAVTLQNPTNGALITTNSARYDIATPNEGNLNNITIYVDGTPIKTIIGDGSDEYSYTQTGISDGQHEWYVTATDIFRRTTTTQPTTFTVNTDITAPTVTIKSPKANSWNKENVPIIVNATDDGIVESVQFRHEKGLIKSDWAQLTRSVSGDWSAVLDITELSGEFMIRINATDNMKNSNTNSYAIINIDSKPPKDIIFLEPQSQQKSTTVKFIAKFNETNPELCEININGTNARLTIQGMSCNGQMSRSDGVYSYNSTITDKAGNKATSVQKTVLIDSTPPELTITGKSPATAQKSRSQMSITATAKDSATSVDKIIAKATIAQPFIEKSPGVYEIITTPESVGCTGNICNVNIIANDTLGNIKTDEVQIIIDDTPPQASITTPASGYYKSQQSITATSNEQLQKAEYRTEGTATSDWKSMSITATATGSTATAQMQLIDGNYGIKVKFTDVAGNENNATVQNIVMDTQKPSIALIAPLQNSNTTNREVNFVLYAEDNNLKEAVLYVDGTLKGTKSGPSGDYNFSANLNTGIHTWYVAAFDKANNMETSESRTFTILQQEQMPTITSARCGRITNSTTLTNNLLSNGTCLTIGAHNIIIDGAGYSISGYGAGIGIDNNEGYDNITITNIKINNYATGINLKNSEKSKITSATINNSFENSQGILIADSNNSTISNTIITMLGNTSTPLTIQNSEWAQINGNALSTRGSVSYAVQFINSSNSLSNNNRIATSGEHSAGIFLQSGENIQMINDVISSETEYSVLTENATAILKNVTFNKAALPFVQGGNGKITIQWNVLAKTTSAGNNLEGVYVTATNVLGAKESDGTTGSEGVLLFLTEATANRTTISYKTPHTITGTKTGYKTSSTSINVKETNSTIISIDLEKEQEKAQEVSGGGTTQTNQSSTTRNNETLKNETITAPVKELPAVIVPTILTTGTKVLSGIDEKSNPVTCADVTKRTTSDSITLLPTKLQSRIPGGYEKIKESFKINCNGETVKFTTAIPDTYKDIRLYSCIEGICTIEYATDSGELSCGEKKILELTAEQLEKLLGVKEFAKSPDDAQYKSGEQLSAYSIIYETPNSEDAVILVPGIFGHKDTFKSIATEFALLKQPWDIITVYYDYNEPLEQLGKKLAGTLDEIDNKKYKNVYIISHSYGGLLAQEALHFMEVQRNKDSSKYKVMQKIRKAILMAAPNKGSPAAEIYKKLDIALLASELKGEKFALSDKTLSQLTTGKTIPRAKGVKYEVIVGTAPYSFTNALFKEIKGENDGVVTTTSAQTIGGEPINNMCKDYYEIKLTHTELNDNPLIARLIMRSINEYRSEQRSEETIAGFTNYYALTINKCSPDTTYTIIGEPILPEEAYDPANCACGNEYCGVGEDESTCPKDCAVIKRESAACTIIIPAVLYLLLSVLLVLTLTSLIKTMLKKNTMRTVIKGAVIELLVVVLAVVQYVQCGSINLLLYASSLGMMTIMLITIIPESMFAPKRKISEQEYDKNYSPRPKILFSIKKFRPYFQPALKKKEEMEPKIVIVKKKYKKEEIMKSLKKAKLWKK